MEGERMNVLVAPDSYKGSLGANEVAVCMEEGILQVFPDARVVKIPIADGGEGTVEAVVNAAGGTIVRERVTGPLGDPVTAAFGILDGGKTAVIEIAQASGYALVPAHRRNPLVATTYGTGQLIRAALDQGCRRLIIGLGGSATNDGGAGVAQALGVKFYDAAGEEIGLGAERLGDIARIDASGLDPRLAECEVLIASDVTNPLCGPNGASAVYGPQKGATPEMVHLLDRDLLHYGRMIEHTLGVDVVDVKGAGAAGGLGAGLIAFLSARMHRGIELILETIRFAERVREADLVLTGEGRTDRQTAFGKAPVGVARVAKTEGKPVICISGGILHPVDELHELGLDALFGIVQSPMPLQEAMEQAPALIRQATAEIMRAIRLSQLLPPGALDQSNGKNDG
jgi:glycerate kinase